MFFFFFLDVCRDLIDNYMFIFDVAEEELQKEAKISETLEKINKHDRGRQALKRSGIANSLLDNI